MKLNQKAAFKLGVGFGALAIATLGIIAEPVEAQAGGVGGGASAAISAPSTLRQDGRRANDSGTTDSSSSVNALGQPARGKLPADTVGGGRFDGGRTANDSGVARAGVSNAGAPTPDEHKSGLESAMADAGLDEEILLLILLAAEP